MTESQEIKTNRIIKRLEGAKKELNGMLNDETTPLTHRNNRSLDGAMFFINNGRRDDKDH